MNEIYKKKQKRLHKKEAERNRYKNLTKEQLDSLIEEKQQDLDMLRAEHEKVK